MSTPIINAGRLHAEAFLYEPAWEKSLLNIYAAMQCTDPVLQDIAADLRKALAATDAGSTERHIKCALLALDKARGEA